MWNKLVLYCKTQTELEVLVYVNLNLILILFNLDKRNVSSFLFCSCTYNLRKGEFGTVKLGDKELSGHPEIVPYNQMLLILMK